MAVAAPRVWESPEYPAGTVEAKIRERLFNRASERDDHSVGQLRGWSVLASGIWLVWSSRRMHEVAVLVRVSQAAERRIARGESGNRVASGQVGLN